MCVERGLSPASSRSGSQWFLATHQQQQAGRPASREAGKQGGSPAGGSANPGHCRKQLCRQGPNELLGITLPAGQPFQLPSFVFKTLKRQHEKEN